MRVLTVEVLRDLGQRQQILDQAQDLLDKNPNDGNVELIAAIAFTFLEEIPPAERKHLATLITQRYPDALPKPGEKPKPGGKAPSRLDYRRRI